MARASCTPVRDLSENSVWILENFLPSSPKTLRNGR